MSRILSVVGPGSGRVRSTSSESEPLYPGSGTIGDRGQFRLCGRAFLNPFDTYRYLGIQSQKGTDRYIDNTAVGTHRYHPDGVHLLDLSHPCEEILVMPTEFPDRIRDLAAQVRSQLPHIQTEEATKNALIMPFISALGYNVFNPTEVTPELHADVGLIDRCTGLELGA